MVRKIILLFILVSNLFMLSCYTTRVDAPQGLDKDVILGTTNDLCFDIETNRVHYLLWGLVPIGNTSSEKIIAEKQITKVKVKTQADFLDGLLRCVGLMFTSGIYAGSESQTIQSCK